MKICYDNLEKFKLTSNGIFLKDGRDSYIEMDACERCGDSYLTLKSRLSRFCSKACVFVDRKFSREHKRNLSKAVRRGKRHSKWKGGVREKKLPLHDTYAERLWCDKVGYKYIDGLKILTVECVNCGKMFIPKISTLFHRIGFLEGKETCESRFYCSDKCRELCPIFWQHKYPKNSKNVKQYTKGEIETWRKEVLNRASYRCEYCGEKATHAHHMKPLKLEPFFALDPDYGIACCKDCHYEKGHSDMECNTGKLSQVLCN